MTANGKQVATDFEKIINAGKRLRVRNQKCEFQLMVILVVL